MYSAVYIVLPWLLTLVITANAKCDKGCNVPVKHYEEMNCEPIYAKAEDCCPTHYNCAKFSGRSAHKCHLYGKEYNIRDEIDTEITIGSCAASCRCVKDQRRDINCANIECPEFFGHSRPKPGCFHVYDGRCCASKTICPPIDKNMAICKVGDKIYYEGQTFESPDECTSCICKPGFEGKFIEPFCSPISCGIELRDSKKVRDNCAPIYYGNSRCCPIDWQCLSDKDTIVPAKKPSSEIQEKCKYGDKELSIGEKVIPQRYSIHSPEINCECRLPPLVTCIQKPYE